MCEPSFTISSQRRCSSESRLQIVMTNRLVLNLIHGANAREDSEFRTQTGLEPPTFATGPYLGNIGGPVRSLLDDFDEENGLPDADRRLTEGVGGTKVGCWGAE